MRFIIYSKTVNVENHNSSRLADLSTTRGFSIEYLMITIRE